MSDLIERLRVWDCWAQTETASNDLLREAADEIERLREQVAYWNGRAVGADRRAIVAEAREAKLRRIAKEMLAESSSEADVICDLLNQAAARAESSSP